MGEEIFWPPKEESDDPKIENSALVKQKLPHLDQSVPMVSLAEAVSESSKSRGTIRRWITEGKIEGAIKTDTGWRIPIASLVTSGAWDGQTKPADGKATEEKADKVSELELELVRVRLELNSEKKLREAAERNADDLRFAMRMLTSGENSRPQQVSQSAGSTQNKINTAQRVEKFDFSPASILDAANKLKRRFLG